MNRIAVTLLAALLPAMAFAQEDKEKQYLPEEGDWAIGVNVVPLLKCIGNGLGSENFGGGTAFTAGSERLGLIPDVSVQAKYMLTDDFGFRANVGLMFGTDKERKYVQDDEAFLTNPMAEEQVIDARRVNTNGMSLNLGAEFRKGSRRVQGVFGAGVLFAFQKQATRYEYGNVMTAVNQLPSSAFAEDAYADGYRMLEQKTDGTFYTGLTGSVGVEWFVAPKISLGAEVNLTAYYLFGTQTYEKSEGYNVTLDRIEQRTDITAPGDRGFHVGTESLGGALYMTFYF